MPLSADHKPRPLVVAAVLLVLVGIIAYASSVLIPIALGILLTFILTPAVTWLQARGLRRNYAVLLVVFGTLLVLLGLIAALTLQLRDLAGDLPAHKAIIREKIQDLTGGSEAGAFSRLSKMVDELSEDLRGRPEPDLDIKTVRIHQEKGSAFTVLPVVAGPLWAFLGKFSLTLGLTTSMLVMREDLRNRVFLLLGEGNLTSSTRATDEASKRISRYLITQVALNASFGAVFGLGLLVMGFFLRGPDGGLPPFARYALVWGVLAAVLRFVPYVGTWMAAVIPVVVSLTAEGWLAPTLVAAWCFVLGQVVNAVVEPMLVSRTTGVTPVAIVVSTAFWTWLWGPIGLVLATPLTVCLSVLGKYVPSLRFLDILLGTAAPVEPEVLFYQRLLARDEAEASDLIDDYLEDHSSEELFDRFIVPALARARADQERGHLSAEELASLVRMVRELIEAALGEREAEVEAAAVCFVCPAHDELDRLALEMLGRLLDPSRARLTILSSDSTAAEVVEMVSQAQPAVVCVGMLPPGGVARARYLCKRLRARHPRLPIVAGVWGSGDLEQPGAQLLAAGATEVTGSLAACRAAVAPLLQVRSQLMEAAELAPAKM